MISLHSFSEIKSIDLHLSHSISLSNSSLPHFEQYFIINLLNLYNSNIYRLLYHSTIFRTIDENATGNANKYGIRNSSYADIANAYNVGGIKGVGNSLSSFITSKDLDNIKEFNRLVSEEGVSSQTAWYKTMQTSSSAAKELFDNEENLIKSGNSVILSEEAISNATNTMTFSAKAGQVALKGLALAGNMLLMLGVSEVISLVATKISDYAHELDNAREAATSAKSDIDDLNKSVSDNGQWMTTNASHYKELADGVDSLGRNVSLTDDEFAEYNSLTNEIADMFPTLVTGYTDTGDAILSCKNNVDLLTQAYKDQKQAAQDAVFQKADDLWSGFKADTTGWNIFSNGGLSKVNEMKVLQDLIDGNLDGHANDAIYNVLNNAGLDVSKHESRSDLQEKIEENQKVLYAYERTLESSMEAATSNVTPIIDAYLDSNKDFQKYDSDMQANIKQFADNMGYEFYSNFDSQADLVDWIDNTLVPVFNDANTQDLVNKLFTLNTDDMSVNEYVTQINEIIDKISQAIGGDPEEIKVKLGFDFVDTDEELLQKAKDKVNKATGNSNTITAGSGSLMGNVKKTAERSAMDSWLNSLNKEDLNLIVDGKVKFDEKTTLASAQEQLKAAQNLADENPVETTISFSDTMTQLDDMKSKLSAVDQVYAKLFDEDNSIGFDDYSSLYDTFKDIEGLDIGSYIKQLQEAGQDQEKVQSTIDSMMDKYLQLSGVLDIVNDSNEDFIVSMLQEQGIANASDIIMSSLAAQKEYAANSSTKLADSTYEDILQIMEEGNVTDETKEYLKNYIIAKANASGYTIQTSGDISNLEDLINALHNAGIELGKFNNLRSGVKTQTNTGTSITTPGGADDNVGSGNKNKNSYIPPVHYTGGSATNSARDKAAKDASKGAKDAEDEAKKAAEEAEKALTDALSHIKNAIDELDKESSDKFSNWSSRNQALADEMGMIPQEIAKQQELYDFYMSQGDTTKAEEAANAIKDLQRNLKELANQKLENIKQFYSDIIDLIDSLKELKNAYIDLKEAKGLVANEVDYRELMAQSEQERQNYEKELTELQNQLQDNINNGYIEEGSEAWYEWQKELNGIKKSIIECKKEQVEWNNAIKKLPFDALEKYTILIQKATDRINGANDILEAKGLSQSVANINEQLMALNETMSVTVHNRKLIFDALHDGLSDSEYGWADLNEDQIQKVFDYINTDDSLGLHDYLTSLGVDMYQFAKDSENSVWSYVQELSTVNQKIQETEKSQIELNKSIRDMGVKSAEAYGKLIDKANADIDNKNTLWEARGMDKTIAHYTEALQGLEMSIGSGSNKRYQDVAKIYQNFADGVNGWSQLDTSQIDKVMEFVNSNDSQGLFTYLGSLGIDASQLDEFWELVEDIQSIDSDITSARQKQIEFNKALQQMDISTYEKLNELLSKAKTEIEGLKSLIESHGKNASDNLLSKQIETSMKTADLSKSMIETYKDYIGSQLSDGVNGWASLTKEQIQKVFSYLDTNDTDGLNKYFSSLGMSAGTLTEFWEIVSKISSEESNIFSEMTNQEKYFDEMLQNRISQLDDIKEKLNKINDAKNKALELGKARYALIQAMNNRNVMTWDGDQMVWTQDSSAVSSATENLNNLEFQALIDSIEDATDSINELIKNMNLYDDNGNLLSNWKEILASAGTSVDDIVSNIIKTLSARGYNFTDPKFNSGNSVVDSKYKDLISVEDVVDRDLLNSLKLAQQQNLIDFKSYLPDYTDTLAKSIRNISSNNTQTTNVTYQLNGDFIMPNIHDDAKLDDFIKDLNSLSSKAEQRVNRI